MLRPHCLLPAFTFPNPSALAAVWRKPLFTLLAWTGDVRVGGWQWRPAAWCHTRPPQQYEAFTTSAVAQILPLPSGVSDPSSRCRSLMTYWLFGI